MQKENYLLYGRRIIDEFLKSADTKLIAGVEMVYLTDSLPTKLRDRLRSQLGRSAFTIRKKSELDRLFPECHHQGVVLRFKKGINPTTEKSRGRRPQEFLQSESGLVLLLDRIQDPHNLGNIVRSAEALGCRALFLSGKGASLTPVVDRTASGATLHLEIFTMGSALTLLEEAKESGYIVIAAAAAEDLSRQDYAASFDSEGESETTIGIEINSDNEDERDDEFDRDDSYEAADQLTQFEQAQYSKGPQSISSLELGRLAGSERVLLVIGHEGEGVRKSILKSADYIITIPLRGRTSSLNAGVAAAILIDRLIEQIEA